MTILKVALKRQQAAEDAIALNMRALATGEEVGHLPQGPIVGIGQVAPPRGVGVLCQESNAERRIRGEKK